MRARARIGSIVTMIMVVFMVIAMFVTMVMAMFVFVAMAVGAGGLMSSAACDFANGIIFAINAFALVEMRAFLSVAKSL